MKWLTLFFALFIIFIIVLADLGKLGILGVLNQIPHGDKAGYFILYGILTLLLNLTLTSSLLHSNRKLIILRTNLILALLIGLEEYSQHFFAKRTFDLVDLLASYLGVLVGGWVAYKIKRP